MGLFQKDGWVASKKSDLVILNKFLIGVYYEKNTFSISFISIGF